LAFGLPRMAAEQDVMLRSGGVFFQSPQTFASSDNVGDTPISKKREATKTLRMK